MPVRLPVLFSAALAGVVLAAAASAAGAADKPTPLGAEGNWAAYTRQSPEGKVCYALSKPLDSLPKTVKRGQIYILINDWPARQVQGEVQIVSGYPFKPDEPVTVTIGGQKIEFFSKNEGSDGFAWVRNAGDEKALLQAMRAGAKLVVVGISKRGTRTEDTYSLKGVSSALDKIHEACGR